MDLIKLKCNNCDAQLDIDLDNLQAYCPYCGQKLLIDFDQVSEVLKEREKTKRFQTSEAETTKRKQMDLEYHERKEKRDDSKEFKHLLLLVLIPLITTVLMFGHELELKTTHITNDEIKVTFSSSEVKGEMYEETISILESLGFTNIELVAKPDLVLGWIKQDGEVEKITINGDSSFSSGDWFPADSQVIITYHTYDD